MLFVLALYGLFTSALAIAIGAQLPIIGSHDEPQDVPGGSIIKLCPGSHENDIFQIISIMQRPEKPYL